MVCMHEPHAQKDITRSLPSQDGSQGGAQSHRCLEAKCGPRSVGVSVHPQSLRITPQICMAKGQ